MVFRIKGRDYKLSKTVANFLKNYNGHPTFRDNEAYDRSLVNTLLVSFINIGKLKNFDLNDPVMNLIRGNLK